MASSNEYLPAHAGLYRPCRKSYGQLPANAGLYHISYNWLLCKPEAALPERRKTMDRRQITGMVLGALMLCLPFCFR